MRPGHDEPALLVMVSLPHMMGSLNWAHQRSLASPASYVYPKDAKAEGRGAWDTTGLSTDLEGFLGEGAVGWL